jgi:hypothetical protein
LQNIRAILEGGHFLAKKISLWFLHVQFKISLSVAEVEKGAFQIGGQSLTNQEEKRASQKVNPNGLTELDLFL